VKSINNIIEVDCMMVRKIIRYGRAMLWVQIGLTRFDREVIFVDPCPPSYFWRYFSYVAWRAYWKKVRRAEKYLAYWYGD
jgi:hypothetical protein